MTDVTPAQKGGDYRVRVTIRNARILRAIEAAGYVSIADFCRRCNISYNLLNALICMRRPALYGDGQWCAVAQNVADALCVPVESLFNARQAHADHPLTVAERDLDAPGLPMIDAAPSAERLQLQGEAKQALADMLRETLTPRQERILRLRFGLDGPEQTLREIAEAWGISSERVRGIEMKALKLLAHPAHERLARDLVRTLAED